MNRYPLWKNLLIGLTLLIGLLIHAAEFFWRGTGYSGIARQIDAESRRRSHEPRRAGA
jgi:hypothetical protein